jgi:hypothetical protein
MSMLFRHHPWDDYIHKPDILWDWCITIKLYPFLCHADGCYNFFFCYDCWLIPALLSDLATTCEDTSLTARIHRFRATLNTGDEHSSHSATWSTLQIRNCICLGPDIRTIDYVIVTFNRLLSIHKDIVCNHQLLTSSIPRKTCKYTFARIKCMQN